jgi:hypothetical protein
MSNRPIIAERGAMPRPTTRPSFVNDRERPSLGRNEQLQASFEEASDSSIERHYRIAGRTMRMLFSGPTVLDRVGRAFSHLLDRSDSQPELTIRIWDSVESGATPPPLPPVDPEENASGAIYHLEKGDITTVFQPGPKVLSVLDVGRDEAWYWVYDSSNMPFWDCAAPMRQILHLWLGRRGVQQVHSGAVGTPDGGVLLVGQPGSGKSTSSLSSLRSELLLFAGDDYVAASLEPEPWVHSLYCSGKLEPDHAKRFPELMEHVWNPDRLDTEKAVFFVHDIAPERTISGFPLRAVLVPRVVGGTETTVSVAPRIAALAALAPSTIIQLHIPMEDALTTMKRLVQAVPCYFLNLGTNVDGIPRTIRSLIDRLNEGDHP